MSKLLKASPETTAKSKRAAKIDDRLLAVIQEVKRPAEVVELFYLSRDQHVLPMLRDWLALEPRLKLQIADMIHTVAKAPSGPGQVAL